MEFNLSVDFVTSNDNEILAKLAKYDNANHKPISDETKKYRKRYYEERKDIVAAKNKQNYTEEKKIALKKRYLDNKEENIIKARVKRLRTKIEKKTLEKERATLVQELITQDLNLANQTLERYLQDLCNISLNKTPANSQTTPEIVLTI